MWASRSRAWTVSRNGVRVGEEGELFVVNGGEFVIPPSWAEGVSSTSTFETASGEPLYDGVIADAQADPGRPVTAQLVNADGSARVVTAVYFSPWEWTLVADASWEELNSAAIAVEEGRAGIVRHSVIAGVLAVLGFSGLGYLISLRLLKPVRAVADTMHDLAQGDGDLTIRLERTGSDEVCELADGFNSFIERVHGIVVGVRDAADSVNNQTVQIAGATEELSAGMQQQTGKVSTASASVDEMASAASEVADRTVEAAGLAAESGRVASEGESTIGETIDDLSRIRATIESAADVVGSLGERGRQIGEIIAVIDDIADQTNLLALNAAIESARAGEHGRGFAVVADEVRKLADRTTHATAEISEAITGIREETDRSVERIGESVEQMSVGVDRANGARASLERITESAESVGRLVEQIASAAKQQSMAAPGPGAERGQHRRGDHAGDRGHGRRRAIRCRDAGTRRRTQGARRAVQARSGGVSGLDLRTDPSAMTSTGPSHRAGADLPGSGPVGDRAQPRRRRGGEQAAGGEEARGGRGGDRVDGDRDVVDLAR